jgi:hypothetical protein
MSLRTIPRAALGGYVKLLRWPLDTTLRLAGRGNGSTSGAALAVDRLDASARAAAGSVMGDDELRRDAELRRKAADEREDALHLRAEAERRSEQADERFTRTRKEAERKRDKAAKTAQQRKQAAEKQRAAKERRAVEAEQKRKQAAEKAAAERKETIGDHAREARIEQLDAKAEALAKKEDALVAKDEARRLSRAAGEKKAARKGNR